MKSQLRWVVTTVCGNEIAFANYQMIPEVKELNPLTGLR